MKTLVITGLFALLLLVVNAHAGLGATVVVGLICIALVIAEGRRHFARVRRS